MKSGRENHIYIAFLLMVYLFCVLFLSSYHELWRDEVRALSLARSADSLTALLASLHNEGHPALWYLLLYLLNSIFESPLILQGASILIAFSATALLVCGSPFNRLQKTLWIFGFYPLYEYAVFARNYGIGMLLLFAYCLCKSGSPGVQRLRLIPLIALPHTSLYGCILALALAFGEFVEVFLRAKRGEPVLLRSLAALLLVGLSACLALYGMYPDSSTEVTDLPALSASQLAMSLLEGLVSHGSFAHNAFAVPFAIGTPLLLCCCYFLLWPRVAGIAVLFCTMLGMELSHRLVYSAGALRHQGFLFLAVIAVFWIFLATSGDEEKTAGGLRKAAPKRLLLSCLLSLLLLLQLYAGLKAGYKEIREMRSSAEQLAEYIGESSQQSALILGEPYYALETLPFYLENPIYFIREQRFGKVASFTAATKAELSLQELLNVAAQLQAKHQVPVLFLLPSRIESPGVFQMMYGRSFQYEAAGVSRLQKEARLLRNFQNSIADENYALYQLNQ